MTTPVDPLARAAMIARCGWDPTTPVVDKTDTLDGDGSTLLTLPSLHVTAVSAVVLSVCPTMPDGDPVTRSLSIGFGREVGWKDNGLLIWQGWDWPGWPVGVNNVAATYSSGYGTEDDPIPEDLAAALASLSKRTPNLVPQSRRMLNASITVAASLAEGGLLTTEAMVFDRYRVPKTR